MAEPMTLDTLKLASTAGLGGWLATLQRTSSEVCKAGTMLFHRESRWPRLIRNVSERLTDRNAISARGCAAPTQQDT